MFKTAIVAVSLLTVAFGAQANNKLVYGTDDRVDFYQANDNFHKELSLSTVAFIKKSKVTLTDLPNGKVKIESTNSYTSVGAPWNKLCTDEPFYGQQNAGFCSGSLVGDDMVMTAGHCITEQSACDGALIVFNYKMTSADQKDFIVSKDDIYNCKDILQQKLQKRPEVEDGRGIDLALLKLDRKTIGKKVLKVRTKGKVDPSAELLVIGHPSGLPTKIAAGGTILDNNRDAFIVASLDTYGGNSGSAVFDAKTGLVEGILVRGNNDFVRDAEQSCYRSNVCAQTGCADSKMKGEDVTRVNQVTKLLELLSAQND